MKPLFGTGLWEARSREQEEADSFSFFAIRHANKTCAKLLLRWACKRWDLNSIFTALKLSPTTRSSMAMKMAVCAGRLLPLRTRRAPNNVRQPRSPHEVLSDTIAERDSGMKAFLLAGGLGTRLRPLTDSAPKCLLPIQGNPMLQIWFDICRQYEIDEVLINVHAHGDAVRRFIQEHKDRLRVHLFEETELLGSAGTVLANREWVNKERSFWVFYADVLTTTNLNQMLAFHDSRGQIATIGVYEVPDPSRCGIVQVDDNGVVREFVEKPRAPVGNLAFSGLMLATPALLDVIPDTSPVDLGFHVLPHIVGRMAAYRIRDFVMDIGTLETFRAAQMTWPGLSQSQELGGIHA